MTPPPPPPIPVTGVSELVLEVADLEIAERFYASTLGWPVVERWPDRDVVWVMAGTRTRIGLWRPQVGLAGSRGGAHVHFALKVHEHDYEQVAAALRDRGLAIHEERFEDGGRAAFVTDPDGHVVEFWTWDVAEHLPASEPPGTDAAPLPGQAGQLLRAAVDAYNRRDIERFCGLADPEIEWWTAMAADIEARAFRGHEGTPSFRGHEGVRRYFGEISAIWDELQLLIDDYREVGRRAVGLGRVEARGHASGVELASTFGVAAEASDLGLRRVWAFLDHERALQAVGLARAPRRGSST